MKISYNWIKEFFPKSSHRIGNPEELAEKLTNRGIEVTSINSFENDTVLELEVTANRGDCLSHLGIAREIAAIYDLPLRVPPLNLQKVRSALPVKIKIEKPYFCYRYFAQIITDLKIVPSPQWMANRLLACDIRPINNVIDITNYVLLESGQPLHAFDYQFLSGQEIIVRWAREKEKIVTLDNQEKVLDKEIPVIADCEKAVALAGIMGGKETAVSENTQAILLESAYFDARVIHRAIKKLNMSTESSYRFERGIDWENVYYAARRASYLFQTICGGKLQSKTVDSKVRKYIPVKISLEFDRANSLLDVSLSHQKIISYLQKLNFSVSKKTKNRIVLRVPSYRNDILQDVDLIEEIARIYGYENIPAEIGYFRIPISSMDEEKTNQVEREIYQLLLSFGFNEVINYSFLSAHALGELNFDPADRRERLIPIKNPVSQEMTYLRTTLLPGLLRNLVHNLRHQVEEIKIFEFGKIYTIQNDNFEESNCIAGLLAGRDGILHWRDSPRQIDFYHLRGLIDALLENLRIKNYQYERALLPYLNPQESFELSIENKKIGEFGELNSELTEKYEFPHKVYLFEIDFQSLATFARLGIIYQPLPRYPSVQRDISFILPERIPQEKVKNLIFTAGGEYLKGFLLFDLFKGKNIPPGWRSLTYRLTFSNPHATLTSEEVEKSVNNIISVLEKELSAQIRKL